MANEKKVVTKKQITDGKTIIEGLETKSSMMRALSSAGWTQGDISRFLTVEYGKLVRPQFVNNVLRRPLVEQK